MSIDPNKVTPHALIQIVLYLQSLAGQEKCREIILDAAADMRDAATSAQQPCPVIAALAEIDARKSDSGITEPFSLYMNLYLVFCILLHVVFFSQFLWFGIPDLCLYMCPKITKLSNFYTWGTWGTLRAEITWFHVSCAHHHGRYATIEWFPLGEAVWLYSNHVQVQRFVSFPWRPWLQRCKASSS